MATKEEIESRSPQANKGSQKRQLLRNLRNGAEAMRKMSTGKSDSYLPIEKNESQEEFEKRVKDKTDLNNSTTKSIDDMVNSIFEKEIYFKTEDEDLNRIVENFDGAGGSLNTWAQAWKKDASYNGAAYALVNFDRDTVKNSDPYVIEIDAEDVHNIRKNDKGQITLFKYEVNYTRPNGDFADEQVKNVFIYKIENNVLKVRTFEGIYIDGIIEDYLELNEKVFSKFNEVPIVELYPETRSKNLDADCPYNDLAEKNLVHWKYNSLYLSLVNTASRPFIFGSGFKQEKRDGTDNKIPFGIKVMYTTEKADAKIQWVQADNQSSDMIIKLLDRLEEEMEVLGSSFMDDTTRMTAEEVKATTADSNARAAKYSMQLEKSLKRIIYFMLKWKLKSEDTEFTLITNKEIGVSRDEQSYNAINDMHSKGLISDKDARLLFKSIEYLPKDLTEEQIVENLEAQKEDEIGEDLPLETEESE